MSIGTIALISLGGLFMGALFLVLRYTKKIALLEKEAEYAEKETTTLTKQMDILVDRNAEPVSKRLSDGSF